MRLDDIPQSVNFIDDTGRTEDPWLALLKEAQGSGLQGFPTGLPNMRRVPGPATGNLRGLPGKDGVRNVPRYRQSPLAKMLEEADFMGRTHQDRRDIVQNLNSLTNLFLNQKR